MYVGSKLCSNKKHQVLSQKLLATFQLKPPTFIKSKTKLKFVNLICSIDCFSGEERKYYRAFSQSEPPAGHQPNETKPERQQNPNYQWLNRLITM